MKRALLLVVLLAGCGDDPPRTYQLYQGCFDDKFTKQMKDRVESIVSCCLDHEIGGMKPPICGADEAECINFLTNNLKQTDADITTQMQACAMYVAEKAMMN